MGSETHVLVQAWNTGLTASKVYQNTTAIGSQGDFSATALWTDSTGAQIGRFSDAPDGCMAYTNGVDSCVWGGDEYRCAGFLVGDPNGTIENDFTEKVANTQYDADETAVLVKSTGTIDSSTMLLLHCDGTNGGTTFTDSSPTTAHTVTALGNANTSTAQYKFGTASGLFDGAGGDGLSIPDNADFDFSGGAWTVDSWVRPAAAATGILGIYFQKTDANNYISVTLVYSATYSKYAIKLSIYSSSSEVVSMTSSYSITRGSWNHIEVSGDGADYYAFVDGVLVGHETDADLPANYTGLVYVACTNISAVDDEFNGNIDEFRVSNVCRHTANFDPWGVAYGTSAAYVYVGATRKLDGVKFYVHVANATTASANAAFWKNSTWNTVSGISDGTSASSKTLAQTGSITWTYDGTEKPSLLNHMYLYWYQFTFSGIDDTTEIYFATVDAPFQKILDLWDGTERPPLAFFKYNVSKAGFYDKTIKVLEEDFVSALATVDPVAYVPADPLTYVDLGGLTSSAYIVIGFAERMTGVRFNLAPGGDNTTKCECTVSYWDGDAWTVASGIVDNTRRNNAKSLSQDGVIFWDAPAQSSESKRSINKSELYYYYKFAWNKTLSDDTWLDSVAGITAPKQIWGYNYPVMWQDRLWLLGEHQGAQDSAICTAQGTVCVFNGLDSIPPDGPMRFGNAGKLTCGATLYTRFGGSVYDNLVVLKENEVWLIDGTKPEDYRRYKISDHYGCVAAGTLKSCDTGFEIAPGINKHVLIWLAENEVVLFDGNSIMTISDDIKNLFDPNDTTNGINRATIDEAEAFYDSTRYEYHLLFGNAANTTKNVELVYDITKRKWFQVDRGTGKYLQCGFPARDTYGNTFTYGSIDTGYVEELETGATFDSTAITSYFKTADIPFGAWNSASTIRFIKHVAVAKTASTDTISISHYGDTSTTVTETKSLSQQASGKRVAIAKSSINWGKYLFHSIKCSFTSSSETGPGYEPLGLAVLILMDRLDTL